MIKASEIAEAISAMDAAIGFVTDSDPGTPNRLRVQTQLIKARVDLEFALKEIEVEVKE